MVSLLPRSSRIFPRTVSTRGRLAANITQRQLIEIFRRASAFDSLTWRALLPPTSEYYTYVCATTIYARTEIGTTRTGACGEIGGLGFRRPSCFVEIELYDASSTDSETWIPNEKYLPTYLPVRREGFLLPCQNLYASCRPRLRCGPCSALRCTPRKQISYHNRERLKTQSWQTWGKIRTRLRLAVSWVEIFLRSLLLRLEVLSQFV